MCLAVPVQIEKKTSNRATVTLGGARKEVSLDLVPDAGAGDWVLVHAGFAITVIDAEQAKETFDVLAEMNVTPADNDDKQ